MRPLRLAAFPDPPPNLILAQERLARAAAALREAEAAARAGRVVEERPDTPQPRGVWDRLRGRKVAPPRDLVPLPPDPLSLAREAHRRARLAHDRANDAHAAWLARTRPSREALLTRLDRRRDRLEAAQHLLHDESWLERDMRALLRAADALCRAPASPPPDGRAEPATPLPRP